MEEKIEIWKPVKCFEGLYSVSSLGRVRSEERFDCRGQLRKEKILSPSHSPKGYLLVSLHKNGKASTFQVHRLVAEAFISNPDNLPQVNHRDEKNWHNNVNNLEWCTNAYNHNYGTRNKRVREKLINGKNSKPVIQYTLDCELVREWPSVNEVERQLGFSHSHICNCCNGKLKQIYGYLWKYKEGAA